MQFTLLPKIINGGIAGVIGIMTLYPLDTVTTRLQNQQLGPSGRKVYSGILDCFHKVYRLEGLSGLYRGCGMNSVLVTPETAIKLSANDFFRFHLTTSDGSLSMQRQMLAGGLAGTLQLIVTTPMELLKIQMQDSGRVRKTQFADDHVETLTTRTIIRNVMRQRGIFGLYMGFQPTAMRDISFSVIYFPLFAFFNDMGPRRSDDSDDAALWVSFGAGLLAGSIGAFVVTPIDVVKTRLQTYKKARGDRQFNGILDCFLTTFKYEGPFALFKGGLCRVLMISPLFAITQVIYEWGIAEYILGIKT